MRGTGREEPIYNIVFSKVNKKWISKPEWM